MNKYNIAVVGATGNVGAETLATLADRKFPVDKVYAIASSGSIGKKVSFGEKILDVIAIDNFDFKKVDIVFFAAGSEVAEKYAKIVIECGCIVIDKSSFFRLDKGVPLIVPEVNLIELKNHKNRLLSKVDSGSEMQGAYETQNQHVLNARDDLSTGATQQFTAEVEFRKKSGYIISNPNCCTIPLAVALKPMDNVSRIKRIVVSTYQSTSGAGKLAMDELYNQTKGKYVFESSVPSVLPKQIAFNLFPHIGDFDESGSTTEEIKIALELEKILGSHVKVSVTCVRVPVFVGHSMSVNVEFETKVEVQELEEILAEADGLVVFSHDNEEKYSTPVEVVGEDFVYISRIRDDLSQENSINFWLVTDNLRKGAALNAVQIAEGLIHSQIQLFTTNN